MSRKSRAPRTVSTGGAFFGWFLAALALAALGLALFCGLTAGNRTRALPRLRACGTAVGGMTLPELRAALAAAGYGAYNGGQVTVTFPDGGELPVTAAELGLEADLDQAAAQVLDYGRDRGLLQGAWTCLRCLFSPAEALALPDFAPDEAALRAAAARAAAMQNQPGTPSVLFQGEDVIRWTRGVPGAAVDEAALCGLIREAFRARRFGPLPYTPEPLPPAAADLDGVYRLLHRDPVDASYSADWQVLPEAAGLSFDLAAAKELADRAAYGETVEIPLLRTEPKVFSAELEALLYRDQLATLTTDLTNNETRSRNIELAAQALDGLTVLPGAEFSYNAAVGERTPDKGYGAATAYVQGALVEEVGGGVCQLSSTLYYTCMAADLEITFRTNHSYYQTYVPYGMDATVSWGWPDFTFRNSREYPIRIEARREGGQLTVTLWGTRTEDYTVRLESVVNAWYPAGVRYEEDPTLKPGESRVADAGRDGLQATTYRCRYDAAGQLLERVEEAVSIYSARDKLILIAPK